MIPERAPSPQPNAPRLHRSRQERLLFGVCGGIAEYLGIDPTIVRIAFVLVALVPPISALSILGYPLLAIIMPAPESAPLSGRDQTRVNITQLRDDAGELVRSVVTRVRSAVWGS